MESLKGLLAVTVLRLIAFLPWRAVQILGAFCGACMWLIPNRTSRVVVINLAHCFPELSAKARGRLVWQTHLNIGRLMTESACAWLWPKEKTVALIRHVEGLEILQAALASGKGVVGIATHIGNWEVLNHYFCALCNPIIFYRPPKLKALDELLQTKRVQAGNRIAPSTSQGILSVIKEVRRGGVVGIPADPEPALSAGIFVPFCGVAALTSKFVPNMLSGGKAEAFFINCLRLEDGSGFRVVIEAAPPAMYSSDLVEATAAMSAMVERFVRADPSQYLWSLKRFKKRPEGEARWY